MKRTYLGKILSITIATATILNLVACNEKAESSNSTTKAPETLTEIVAENTTVPTEYITEIVNKNAEGFGLTYDENLAPNTVVGYNVISNYTNEAKNAKKMEETIIDKNIIY